jgi:hypothetical protein
MKQLDLVAPPPEPALLCGHAGTGADCTGACVLQANATITELRREYERVRPAPLCPACVDEGIEADNPGDCCQKLFRRPA